MTPPNDPASTFRLYDTARRAVVPFVPADPARITFYTCGPTVYDDAHIGNFRSFLAADLLRRWLESRCAS
jgi:cysteinyl-tRNA synthetase